jgi:hypothetical protein
MKPICSISLAFLLWAAWPTANVFSCTCAEATVADYRKSARSIFLGTAVSKKRSSLEGESGVEITFKVEQVWKGKTWKQITVHTGPTEDLYDFLDLCAPHFQLGQKYIVFGYGKTRLKTDTCAGTGGFPYAETIITKLGPANPAR